MGWIVAESVAVATGKRHKDGELEQRRRPKPKVWRREGEAG